MKGFVLLAFAALIEAQVSFAHGPLTSINPAIEAADCTTLVKKLNEAIKETGLTPVYNSNIKTPTVEAIGTVDGAHGGKQIMLKRLGSSWVSDFRTVVHDPQGDPRWFVELLGSDVADFFGFKIIDDFHMMIPDFKEFDGALDKVNAALKARGKPPLAVRFYPTENSDNVSVSKYVNRFLYDQAIPFAPSGNHLLHDVSFHTGGIFLPKEIVDFKLEKIRFEQKYFTTLKARFAEDPKKLKAVKYFEYLNNYKNTKRIDVGSANVQFLIMQRNRLQFNVDDADYIGDIAKYFTAGTLSPIEDLKSLFNIANDNYRVLDGAENMKIRGSFDAISLAEFEEMLIDFSKTYRSPSSAVFSPSATFMDLKTAKKITCETINGKRLLVREVVLKLKANAP